ncbi:hypothetical protein IMSHALPRED_000046 [Imshaugia aleurites]|uniref:Uncharacterized protein n=1 Tax=Imshaugia aleurites TaxID=172621 RepID=A0A8H3I274_9LECA|nr:hypothetical protein IMSHALPRED_000046 [Imshaugia aleurites]
MAIPSTPTALTGSNDWDIASIVPIGPVYPSNSDVALTLPFNKGDVSQELRAEILERTKEHWGWFAKAEEQDQELGTQLGTLGFLPWEIRQKIIVQVFDRNFLEMIDFEDECGRRMLETHEIPAKPWCRGRDDNSHRWDYPDVWSLVHLQRASVSMSIEVQYIYFTLTKFMFDSPNALVSFLGRLTTYQQSLLRWISLLLLGYDQTYEGNETWMDVCEQLPAGLTSIEFYSRDLTFWEWADLDNGSSKVARDTLRLIELLSNRIKRCWAPKAKIGIDPDIAAWRYRPAISGALSSTCNELEDWSKEWLEWWATSQEDEHIEGQPPLLGNHSDPSQDME